MVKTGQIAAVQVAAAPLVSVVVACRNDSSQIQDTLDAVLAQTFTNFELIVVDRGSDDPSANWAIQACADSRIRAIDSPGAKLGSAWNAGIDRAAARYICCLESGQKLTPTHLEKCLFVLETSSLGFCLTRQWSLNRNVASPHPGPLVMLELLRPDYFASAAVFRKDLWSSVDGFDDDAPPGCEAWDLWIRLAKSGGLAYGIPDLSSLSAAAGPDALKAGALRQMRARHAGLFGNPNLVSAARVPASPVFSYAALMEGAPVAGGEPAILLVMPALTMGGAEASISQVCRLLKEIGFRILLVTAHPPMENRGDTTPWFKDSVAAIYHLPAFLESWRWKGFIFYLLQKHSIDILWQVGSSYLYTLTPEIKQYFPGIAIVDLLFNPVGHTASHLKYQSLIDHVVTEHKGMRAWLLEHGVAEENVSVIPNGVDLDWFSPQPANGADVSEAPSGRRGFVAGFFGRLSDEKAPDLFIDIAAQFFARQDTSFMICGAGPLYAALQARVQAGNLGGKVRFLGFVDTREHLKLCDVVVVCSRMDGRPNIVMEAAAMGIPVVASRIGGIPEMVQHGVTGILCEAGDVAGFSAALFNLADRPDLRVKMGRAAREWAERHFSHREAQKKYAGLFERLIRTRAAAGAQFPPRNEVVPLHALQPGPWPASRPTARLTGYTRAFMMLLSPHHLRSAATNVSLWVRVRGSRDLTALLQSLFDRNYYLSSYPEVADSGIPPLLHYLFYGFRELRNPSLQFDTGRYLRRRPDVAVAGVNPLLHYILNEGTRPDTGDSFDAE